MKSIRQMFCVAISVVMIFAMSGIGNAASSEDDPNNYILFDWDFSLDVGSWSIKPNMTATILQNRTFTLTGGGMYTTLESGHIGYQTYFNNIQKTGSSTLINGGTLINNGTLIISAESEYMGVLTNRGSLVNNGTIIVTGGKIDNHPGGTITNNGLILIESVVGNNSAIQNISADGKSGAIVNEGTIHAANTSGTALNIHKGASVQNKGTIVKTTSAVIKGSISGNTVVVNDKFKYDSKIGDTYPDGTVVSKRFLANVKDALKNADGKAASMVLTNAGKLDHYDISEALLLAEVAEKDLAIYADTKTGSSGKLQGRLYILPQIPSYSDGKRIYYEEKGYQLELSIYNQGTQVDQARERFVSVYSNNCAVFYCAQKEFMNPRKLAVALDLSKLDTTKLKFYRYNSTQKLYIELEKPGYKISKDGLLVLTTNYGGGIIVTDGKLKAK